MKNLYTVLRSLILISTIVLPSVFINSCQIIFELCEPETADFCKLLSKAKVSEITDSSTVLVREAQDTLIIFHGTACAKSSKDGTEDIILIQGRQFLPSYVTKAAVFLNGWNHNYLGGDHHFAGNGLVIRNIFLGTDLNKNNLLTWNTIGAMSDDDFDDSYSMCYNFTVIGWNTSAIDINIDQNDGGCDTVNLEKANFFTAYNTGTTTALSSFTSFLQSDNFKTGNSIAILPRGFFFAWNNCDDHHLFQMGYNLEHNDQIMQGKDYRKGSPGFTPGFPDNVSKVDSGFVSWETYTVLKDNDRRRDYRFGEMVSGMSGSDVRIIQPPYSFLPRDNVGVFGACSGSLKKKEEFFVERVPFKYAIPVLSGWELGFLCNDHHIKISGSELMNGAIVLILLQISAH